MKKRKSKFLWATRENPCFRKRAIIRADPNLYPILSEHRWLDIRAVRKFRNLQRFPRAETRNCMLISRFRFILERNVTFFHTNNIDRRVLSFLLILEFFSFSNDQLWGIFDGNSSPLFETRWIVGQPFEERGISRNSMLSRISRDSLDLSRFCLISYGFSRGSLSVLDLFEQLLKMNLIKLISRSRFIICKCVDLFYYDFFF